MNLWITQINSVSPLWLASLWRASWQGGLAVLLAWGISYAFPRLPARVKVWMWRLAFIKLLVTFVWTTPIDLALLPVPAARVTPPLAIEDSSSAAAPALLPPVGELLPGPPASTVSF